VWFYLFPCFFFDHHISVFLPPPSSYLIFRMSSSFNVSGEDTDPEGLVFNSDGTKMYIVGRENDNVYRYKLGTAYDLSTVDGSNVTSFDIGQENNNSSGLTFKPDGKKLFVTDFNRKIHRYEFNNAYDISTENDTQSTDVSGEETTPEGISFSKDGQYMFIVGEVTTNVYRYDLNKAYDITTAEYNGMKFDISGETTDPHDLRFNLKGTKMFVIGGFFDDTVYGYDLGKEYDLNTVDSSNVTSFDVSGEASSANGLDFNSDGTKMFVVGESNEKIYRYNLGTGYDLGTVDGNNVANFDVSGEVSSPKEIAFNLEGTKMFVIGGFFDDTVYGYDLGTAYDLSTADSSNVTSFDVSGKISSSNGLRFRSDGTKMFILGSFESRVYQYTSSEEK